MEKIEKSKIILHINVKTNSKKQEILYDNETFTIFVKSKPVKNKANKEIVYLLRNKLKIALNQIKIISGEKSKNKVIQIEFLEEEGDKALLSRLLS
ncbi:MAG: DUF167 domain-containing protein [Promethearchaeota archaeon]